jgi:hypothetical protein
MAAAPMAPASFPNEAMTILVLHRRQLVHFGSNGREQEVARAGDAAAQRDDLRPSPIAVTSPRAE